MSVTELIIHDVHMCIIHCLYCHVSTAITHRARWACIQFKYV